MFLRVSTSFLAKRRGRGRDDGPAFVLVGRSIKYTKAALLQWTSANTHQPTTERDNLQRFRRSRRAGLKRNPNT
jgi:hypothetical protein